MNEEGRDLRNIFWTGSSAKKYLLVLVAHPDDFEIGCLGTILKLHKSSEDFAIRILTFCAQNNVRKEEQEKSIRDLKELNINIELTSFAFADTFLADSIKDVKKEIRNIEQELHNLGAEICVITHHKNDKHQDHQCINNAVTQTLRNHRIISIHIPKYEEENFNASFYVSLQKDISENKVDHIMRNFPSQNSKIWFGKEVFLGQLRIQGVHANCEFAEVFSIEKMRV